MDADWLEVVLKRHERKNRIAKVTNMKSELAIPSGENYMSSIYRVTIDLILEAGRKTTRKAIVKEDHTGKKHEIFKEFAVFKVETKIYTQVLEKMGVLMDSAGDRNDTLWCKLYGFKPYSIIVFQDLSDDGYVVPNRKECLDIDHAMLVLRSLARFHAMSKILLTTGIVSNDDFLPCFHNREDSPVVQGLFNGTIEQLSKAIDKSWPSEWKDVGLRVGKQSKLACSNVKKLIDTVESDRFEVLDHGDLWSTNMMFKYSEDKKPIGVKYAEFLDFQTSHVNSYVFDIVYFINTSVKADVRRGHMDKLLDCYLEMLHSTLKFYKYEGFVPGKDHLERELSRTQYYAFVILSTIHPITTADSTKAFDTEKLVDDSHALSDDVLGSVKLMNSIGPDLKNFIKNGVI